MTGTVEGHLEKRGWGAGRGYPGLRLVTGGPSVRVQVLTSGLLPDAWGTIDAFEGEDYRRVLAAVRLDGGDVTVANIYELRE